MPYDQHVVVEKEGKTYLQTRYGDFPIYIPDRFFLINLNAARLACRQLGVKDADFIRHYPNIVYLCSHDYSETKKKGKYSRIFVVHVAGGRPDTCQ